MSSHYYRVKKGQSLMLSLYSVSLLPLFFYISVTFLILWTLVSNLNNFIKFHEFIYLMGSTVKLISISLFLSLFIAGAISYYFLSHRNVRSLKILKSILYYLNEMPIILYGILPLYFINQSIDSFYIIYTLIAIPKITSRWLKCSQNIKSIELESIRSLGFNSFQSFKILYFDQFIKLYLAHVFSVFCLLFFVVTPFVWMKDGLEKPLALHIFSQLGESSKEMSSLLIIFLVLFLLKFWVDKKIKNLEVESV